MKKLVLLFMVLMLLFGVGVAGASVAVNPDPAVTADDGPITPPPLPPTWPPIEENNIVLEG